MELSGKTVYGPVLRPRSSLRVRNKYHASPERCRKSVTIFLGDHDFPLTGSNFGNLTAFKAIFMVWSQYVIG